MDDYYYYYYWQVIYFDSYNNCESSMTFNYQYQAMEFMDRLGWKFIRMEKINVPVPSKTA